MEFIISILPVDSPLQSQFVLLLFLLSTAFVLYVLIGYPALLGLLARRPGPPVAKAPQLCTVSVILPVFNGEAWIGSKLETLRQLDYPQHLVEIIVISDGSEDSTDQIVGSVSADNVHLLRVPRGGKANALNAGIARATGEILFFTDVRQALAPDSLTHLVACLSDPAIGVVSGELIIRKGESLEEASVGAYWKYEKWIRNRLSRIDSVLGATGCIYAMRRDLARVPLPKETLLDDMYLPLGAFFSGHRVIFESAAKAFDYPTSLDSEFRRKVRTLAGVYQTIGDYPALLSPIHNRMWIHFMSHKFGRLLLPWALIAIAVSTFYLPHPLKELALGGQVIFYLTASADRLIPERSPLKRLTSPIRTFVALMAASLFAVSIFFRPGTSLWSRTSVKTAKS
jgi:cellulose synthase/poly-beta-1,6-N-acetylglucosamine synthase-like glycosyltransferase